MEFIARILLPTDLHTATDIAFGHALRLALTTGARLSIVHVQEDPDAPPSWDRLPDPVEVLKAWNLIPDDPPRQLLRALADRISMDTLLGTNPISAVAEEASIQSSQLLVMSTAGRVGMARVRKGSLAEDIARRTALTTLFLGPNARPVVDPDDGHITLTRVLVPLCAAHATRAIEAAAWFVGSLGVTQPVQFTLLHIGTDAPPSPALPAHGGWTFRHMQSRGEITERIVLESGEADLVVMVTDGHDNVLDQLHGSNTEQVLRAASCPVLAIPA